MPVVVSLPHPTDPGTVYTSAELQRNRWRSCIQGQTMVLRNPRIDQQGVAALTYPR